MVGFTGSPVRIVYANVTLTRSKLKVKVTELLKFRKLHFCMFSRPISSAILPCSSKLMADYDTMVGAI